MAGDEKVAREERCLLLSLIVVEAIIGAGHCDVVAGASNGEAVANGDVVVS